MIHRIIRRLCRLAYRDIFERSYGAPTDVDEVWRHREMLQDARRPKRYILGEFVTIGGISRLPSTTWRRLPGFGV